MAPSKVYVPTGKPKGRAPKNTDPEHLKMLALARERRKQGLPTYKKTGKPRGRPKGYKNVGGTPKAKAKVASAKE